MGWLSGGEGGGRREAPEWRRRRRSPPSCLCACCRVDPSHRRLRSSSPQPRLRPLSPAGLLRLGGPGSTSSRRRTAGTRNLRGGEGDQCRSSSWATTERKVGENGFAVDVVPLRRPQVRVLLLPLVEGWPPTMASRRGRRAASGHAWLPKESRSHPMNRARSCAKPWKKQWHLRLSTAKVD